MPDSLGDESSSGADRATAADEAPATPAHSSSGARRRALTRYLVAAVAVLAADQTSKAWALAALDGRAPVEVVGSLLRLSLVRNSGAAFSIGSQSTWVMTLIALAVTAGILVMARRVRSATWGLALGLVLGGSLGNLVDRFVRPPGPGRGHVVDFLDYGGLFVGNVADIAIVVGALMLLWLTMRGVDLDAPDRRAAARSGAEGAPRV